MTWVKLNSKSMQSADYDAKTKILRVRFGRFGNIAHSNIPQHVYENLIQTLDADFYYSYYVEPGRIKAKIVPKRIKWMRRLLGVFILTTGLAIPEALQRDASLIQSLGHVAFQDTTARK